MCVFNNLPASELTYQLKQIASINHENYDSFVCCILSHGYLDGVYGSDGEIVKIDDIMGLFRHNTTLASKPKLFYIYTCCKYVAGKEAVAVAPTAKIPNDYLPNETDFLFICSINMTWRNRSKYISVFHDVTKMYAAQKHLLNLLNIVDDKILEANGCKPKCCPASNITATLHKELWFFN